MNCKAIFLDRDGVINEDRGYTYKISDFAFLSGVPEALAKLKAAGFKLIVITNQSGVARGYYTLADVEQFHLHMQRELLAHGVQIDDFQICPHHPDGKVSEFSRSCTCRKPNTDMIEAAVSKHGISLEQSYLVGDKYSDIECAKRAGVRAIQVCSKESKSHPWALKEVDGLADACHLIVD